MHTHTPHRNDAAPVALKQAHLLHHQHHPEPIAKALATSHTQSHTVKYSWIQANHKTSVTFRRGWQLSGVWCGVDPGFIVILSLSCIWQRMWQEMKEVAGNEGGGSSKWEKNHLNYNELYGRLQHRKMAPYPHPTPNIQISKAVYILFSAHIII